MGQSVDVVCWWLKGKKSVVIEMMMIIIFVVVVFDGDDVFVDGEAAGRCLLCRRYHYYSPLMLLCVGRIIINK